MLVRPVHSAKSPEPRRHKSEGRLTGPRLFADPQHLWWCRIHSCCDCCSCKVAGSVDVAIAFVVVVVLILVHIIICILVLVQCLLGR